MEDGLTLEQHLLSIWKQTGQVPEQLDLPPVPYEIQYIWDWWLDLNKSRSSGMSACHITYTEIANWSKLLKINVTAFEVRCIMDLDSLYLSVTREQQERQAASAGKK